MQLDIFPIRHESKQLDIVDAINAANTKLEVIRLYSAGNGVVGAVYELDGERKTTLIGRGIKTIQQADDALRHNLRIATPIEKAIAGGIPANGTFAFIGTVEPQGWQRTSARSGCGSFYRHSSGWCLQHCGHPTAVFPYCAYNPQGEPVLSENGKAFQTVRKAFAELERRFGVTSNRIKKG